VSRGGLAAGVWTPASADPAPGEINSVTFSNIQSAVLARAASPYANLVGSIPRTKSME
jgi:hypothetical protein